MSTENTTAATDAASTGRLFDQIVADAKGTKKSLNAKLTENAIKRKFSAAFDSAEAQKDQAAINYNIVISDLDGFNVNALVQAKATIDAANDTQELIKETYAELFDEDLGA